MSDADLATISNYADDLETGLRSFIALGGLTDDDADDVMKALDEARKAVEAKKASDARAAVLRGEIALDHLVSARGAWWRFVNIHQVPLFAYHVVLALIFAAIGTTCYLHSGRWCVVPDQILEMVPVAAVAAGGLGAALRGIWYLWNQVSRRIYYRRFLLGHLAAPMVGMILGILTYLLAKAGLFLIGGKKASDSGLSYGELALCMFVGFKWEWALEQISAIFMKKNGSKATPPADGGAAPAGKNHAADVKGQHKDVKGHHAEK